MKGKKERRNLSLDYALNNDRDGKINLSISGYDSHGTLRETLLADVPVEVLWNWLKENYERK